MGAKLLGGFTACMAWFAAATAWAEPQIEFAPGVAMTPETPIGVVITDLDPGTPYWVTVVPAAAELGAYDEFHYVEAVGRVELEFAGVPADSYEIRLHERTDGDPLIARLAYDPGAGTPQPVVSETTRAFAAAYGLTGDWTGGYVCPDGAADVTLTLWPGAHENRYAGRMRATLRDGPDAGAAGEWPAYAEHSPKYGVVGLGFEAPRIEPRPRYGMAGLREATLSEDGARIEGGSFVRHGCNDFELTRVPVAAPEDAAVEAAALARRGFWGEWSGRYACSGVETALDLDFAIEPTSGRLEARWRYSGGEGRRVFSGEAVFRVVPASGGAVELQPLRWLERPRGHVALPVTARIGPDGRRLQGEVAGCGRLNAERVGDPPAPPDPGATVLSAETRAGLAGLEGAWEGAASCDGTELLVRLDLSGAATARSAGEFRHVAAEGIDTVTHLRLALEPRADASLAAEVAERIAFKQSGPVYAPAAIEADGEDVRVLLDGGACEPATLSRPPSPTPLTIASEARDAPAGALFVASTDGRSLRPAPTAQACAALGDWIGTLSPQERQLNRAGSWVLGWGGWPALFAEARFTPVFGASYPTLAGSPDVGRFVKNLARSDCRGAGIPRAPELATALDAAFGLDRNTGFGTNHHKFRRAAAAADSATGRLPGMLAEISAIPVTPEGAAALDRLRAALEPQLGALGEADRAEVQAALDAHAQAIARSTEDDLLARLADGRTPATLARLRGAEEILATRELAAAAAWRARLAPQATALAARELAPGAPPQRREAFAALAVYPAVADRLAALDRDDAAAAEARLRAVEASLAAADRIEALRPVRAELRALSAEAPAADRSARMWRAFDHRAETLLGEAVARLPEAQPAPAPRGTAPDGIKQRAFVAALLSGDRDAAYRVDRDYGLIYLQRMTAVFRAYCPAALPSDLQTRIASKFMDMDALSGGRDAMVAAGLRALAEGVMALADPGAAMSQAIRVDEIRLVADGDAQILLNAYPCTGPELRALFENARAYVIDPAEGVAADALRMGDVCRAAFADRMITRDTEAYCTCSGAVLDEVLDDDAKRYLRAEPGAHYRQLGLFAREADLRIQSCRR